MSLVFCFFFCIILILDEYSFLASDIYDNELATEPIFTCEADNEPPTAAAAPAGRESLTLLLRLKLELNVVVDCLDLSFYLPIEKCVRLFLFLSYEILYCGDV